MWAQLMWAPSDCMNTMKQCRTWGFTAFELASSSFLFVPVLRVRSERVRNRGTTDIEMPARTEEEHLQRGVATVRNKLGIILQRK